MQKAILQFYSQCKLFPSGVVSEIPAVQDWAMKMSIAIAKMVTLHIVYCHGHLFLLLGLRSYSVP